MYSLLRAPSSIPYRRIFSGAMHFNHQTLNVIQLGVGFFFIFFAFNSQGFVEETVIDSYAAKGIVDKHDGYTSLAIIYFVFTISNFVAAPIVALLNARWAMVFGAFTYMAFQFGFLFLNQAYLYFSSALLGLGAAVIWTAQGKYLALNSNNETAGRHSGLFWAISQACLISGGIFLYVVLRDTTTSIDPSAVRILYGVFSGVTVLGTIILAFLRMPYSNVSLNGEVLVQEPPPLSYKETMVSTWHLAKTKRMLILVIVFAYTGVELSFWSGIYPTTISFTNKLGNQPKILLAFNAITQGLGQATSGFLFGILSSKTRRLGRDRIVLLGALIHLVAFVLIYINFPFHAPLGQTNEKGIIEPSVALALVCGFLLGFGDACWNTQIFALIITKYSSRSAQAFSLFKFFQSLLTCAAFFYSKILELQWHLLILVVGLIAASLCFCIAERISNGEEEAEEITTHDD